MGNPHWRWLRFEHAKAHLVSAGLVSVIVADMKARDCVLESNEPIVEFSIDMPGMCRTDRPIETFRFMGLSVSMPTEDVASFAAEAGTLEPRGTGGRQYFKLHGFHRCWVLSDAQRRLLLARLLRMTPAAEAKTQVFYADKQSPAEALREAAAKGTGRPVETMPDLGGHKLDRFFGAKGQT